MKTAVAIVALLVAAVVAWPRPTAAPAHPASDAAPRLTMPAYFDWPTYHGGYSLTGATDIAVSDRPVRLWIYKADGPVEATPVAGGGRIYFTTTRGTLVALDVLGNLLWSVDLPGEAVTAPPLYCDGTVLVGSIHGRLRAFDAATGGLKWHCRPASSIQGTPNRVNLPDGRAGVFVVSQAEGSVRVLDLDTGDLLWTSGDTQRCDGSAGAAAGRIVMGSCGSALHHVSMEKATRTIGLDPDNQVAGGVAVSGTTAFAGTRKGQLVAVDLVAGKVLWANQDSRGELFTTPAVDDRFVVFGAADGVVRALRRDTGAPAWAFDSGGLPSSPVLAGNRVVVSSGGSLATLDLESGKKIWNIRVSDEITSPAIVGGWIVVGADDGTVTAFGGDRP